VHGGFSGKRLAVARDNEKLLLPAMNSQTELPVIQAGLDRGRELFAKRQADPALMAKFEASVLDNTKSGTDKLNGIRAACQDEKHL
jgi:hypothetical protein